MRIGGDGAVAIMSDESGQAQVLAVLCLTVIMAGMALAIDVGNLYFQQRKWQTAADAAAIAAGLELGNCSDTTCANMNTAAATALVEEGITAAALTPTNNQCTVPSSSGLAM